MKPGTKWILIIIGLLTLNVLASTILMLVANDRAHSQVLPTYRFEAK